MPTTWTIAVDWDRDGSYAETYDNITNRVISANWFLGMRRTYQDIADDSMLELILDNQDRLFSPEAEFIGSPPVSNPLHGKILPFTPVRVQSDDGTLRTHWTGWIESIEPSVNQYGERRVTITAAGPMQFMKAAETDIELQKDQRTDEIVRKLLTQVVILQGFDDWFLEIIGYSELGVTTKLGGTTTLEEYGELEKGFVHLAVAGDNWVQRSDSKGMERNFNVYRALGDVTAAERGRFLFGRNGQAIFWNRGHLQEPSGSSVTLDNAMTDLAYVYGGLDDLKNEVFLVCHPREVGTEPEILWALPEPLVIQPDERRVLKIRYQDRENNNLRIGGENITIDYDIEEDDLSLRRVRIVPRATSAKIILNNRQNDKPVTLRSLRVWGIKITDYGQMEAESRDSFSITRYGRRSMQMNVASVDRLRYGQYIADYEVKRRKDPRGMVKNVTLRIHGKNGGENHEAQLDLTLGDTVYIAEQQTAHPNTQAYHIIGEAHRLSQGATLLETTWYLEPLIILSEDGESLPWKLSDGTLHASRSQLETSTFLAF